MSENPSYPAIQTCYWLLNGKAGVRRALPLIERAVRGELAELIAEDGARSLVKISVEYILYRTRSRFRNPEVWKADANELFSSQELHGLKLNGSAVAEAKEEMDRLEGKCRQLLRRLSRVYEDQWFEELLRDNPEVIVSFIKAGGKRSDKACEMIMKVNENIVYTLTGRSGEEYRDLGHTAMVNLIKAVQTERLTDPRKVHSYFITACQNQFKNRYRKQKRTERTRDDLRRDIERAQRNIDPADNLAFVLSEALARRNQVLYQLLAEAGRHCQEILLGLAKGRKAKQLAEELDKEVTTVYSRATQCRRQLLDLILDRLGTPCGPLLQKYELHRRRKRSRAEEIALLSDIQKKLDLPDKATTQKQLSHCLERLYEFFFPKP